MAFIQLGMDIADAMIQIGEDLGQWLYDGVIVPVADAITSALMWVADGITAAILWAVNAIKNAFNFIVGLGKWIWDTIKAGLEFIGDLGSKIWEWFKGILSSIGDGLKSIVNGMIRILNKVPFVNVKQITDGVVSPGGQVVSVAPDDWLIATKDPKSLGGGGDTINISVSGNSFKNENDMRKMVDMISKELQRKGNRSFS